MWPKHPYANHSPGLTLPEGLQFGLNGPDVEWIETLFPPEYLPKPGFPVFEIPHESWPLGELLDQLGRLVLALDCTSLMLYLHRTDSDFLSLDLHLPAGMVHLMGWSPATSLALTSGNGFDPAAPENLITIRSVPPEAANVRWDGAKFVTSPSPA